MDFLSYQENRTRGKFDFPVEFHYVDSLHPRYQMPLHWHVETELILVLQGRLSLHLNEQTWVLNTGDVALVSSGVLHGGEAEECIYECIVYAQEHFLRCAPATSETASLREGSLCVQAYHPAGSPVAVLADHLFEAMESEYEGYELVAQGLLLQVYGTALRDRLCQPAENFLRPGKRLQPLKNALKLIRENYAQPLALAQLAQAAGMSPRYFCRYFQQLTQKTPIEYLNYFRIECACEQLLLTEDSITDVAFNCGFNDVSYFIKIFHRCKGVSPKRFRTKN